MYERQHGFKTPASPEQINSFSIFFRKLAFRLEEKQQKIIKKDKRTHNAIMVVTLNPFFRHNLLPISSSYTFLSPWVMVFEPFLQPTTTWKWGLKLLQNGHVNQVEEKWLKSWRPHAGTSGSNDRIKDYILQQFILWR